MGRAILIAAPRRPPSLAVNCARTNRFRRRRRPRARAKPERRVGWFIDLLVPVTAWVHGCEIVTRTIAPPFLGPRES
jgi:hypothetical protein